MANNKQISYKVIKDISILSETPKRVKAVKLVSWDGRKPVIDIRSWYMTDKGFSIPTKGITLSYSELCSLINILGECVELLTGKQVEPTTVKEVVR